MRSKHRRLVVLRHRPFADDPLDEIVVLLRHDGLELVKFGVRKTGKFVFGELPEDQIHFPDAAMPGTKKNPSAARIKIGARACDARHRKSFLPPLVGSALAVAL